MRSNKRVFLISQKTLWYTKYRFLRKNISKVWNKHRCACGRADRVGCVQLSYVPENNPPLFHRLCRLQTLLKVCGIDCYDDLLLPGHRLLAQNPLFASGERFKKKLFRLYYRYCNPVYFSIGIVK